MHVVYGWALWQQLCEMATDESRSLLSYGPSRPGVRNMCELKLHFLIYTFLTQQKRTDTFDFRNISILSVPRTIHLSGFPELRKIQKRSKWGSVLLRSCRRDGLEKLIRSMKGAELLLISFSRPLHCQERSDTPPCLGFGGSLII